MKNMVLGNLLLFFSSTANAMPITCRNYPTVITTYQ